VSAVMTAREPSVRYLAASQPPLLEHFELVASAPGGVARLRELILTLAVQGKLVAQSPNDEPGSVLLDRIRSEKARLLSEGRITREKPLADITADELPFNLPWGWRWVRLGALLQKIGAGSTPRGGREVYVPSGIKFLRSQNVWNDGLRLASVAFITQGTHSQMIGTVVKANDLLFNITGASIGRCAVVPAGFDEANVSQHVTILRPVLPALNAYLHTVMISRRIQQSVMDVQVGVSREGLSIAKLSNFLIPLPPLAEQSRIVARVEELMRMCDALEAKGGLEDAQHAELLNTLLGALTDSASSEELAANWQRVAAHFDLLLDRPQAVDALEQTVLQLAVRGLLVPQKASEASAHVLMEEIRAAKALVASRRRKSIEQVGDFVGAQHELFPLPPAWAWVRFGEVSINRDGERVPVSAADREQREKLYDYYGASGVIDKIDGFLFDKTLLLIGEDGANLINRSTPVAFLAHGKYWVNNHAHVIDATHPGLLAYLALFINAISLKPYVTGTAQPKMNQAKLSSILIALPPLEEQARILARVEQLRRLCADLREKLADRQTTQARLADALVESTVSAG
jgi:type I restriction enzyme, S subunit